MSNQNTNQNHPLIPRQQTYVLDRKIVSFHSTDRDISKWPEANHFEIMLPEKLHNVQSMRLDTISIPNDQYVFSRQYQNTKLSFSLKPYAGGTYEDYYTITIDEGSYTPQELVIEIQTKMNQVVTDALGTLYPHFVCQYNKVTNTFWFGNTLHFFSLRFDVKHDYGLLCPNQTIAWDRYTNWGLPSYLGYQKTIYESGQKKDGWNLHTKNHEVLGGPFGFDYSKKLWLGITGSTTNWYVDVVKPDTVQKIDDLAGIIGRYGVNWCWPCNDNRSPYPNVPGRAGGPPPPAGATDADKRATWRKKAKICNINIMGEDVIYMELDRYNTIDEIAPYSKNTSAARCNDYHGKVKSAFAKIPLPCTAFSQIFDSRNAFLMNVSQYEPPLERLTKLKFKFRYHDGRLVDFKCLPLSFSIEFNMLRNEQLRAKVIRKPVMFNL